MYNMYRKVLCIAVVTGISLMGFSQTNDKSIENIVQQRHQELMTNIENGLKNKSNVCFGAAKKGRGQQFLLNNSKVHKFTKDNKKALKDVYKGMVNNNVKLEKPVYFSSIEVIKGEDGREKDKIFGKGTKVVKKNKLVRYYTKSEVNIVTKKGNDISNAKNDVILEWVVYKNKPMLKTTLLTKTSAMPKDYLKSEIIEQNQKISDIAKERIKRYYADLANGNADIQEKLSSDIILNAAPTLVNDKDIVIPVNVATNIQRQFISTSAPDIKVYVNPQKYYLYGDASIYDNDASAYYNFKPTFFIHFPDKEDLTKDVIFKVELVNDGFTEPVISPEKVMQKAQAQNSATDYVQKLQECISNIKTRDDIRKMFFDNSTIEVANIVNGKTKISERSVKEYFYNLQAIEFKVILDHPDYPKFPNSPDLTKAIFLFNQKYISKNYKDCTDKEIYLKYDKQKEQYLIEKITVVGDVKVIDGKTVLDCQ